MKKRNLVAALFASIAIFSSCKKCDPECKLIPAKIIRYDCDRVIFQLLTPQMIGDADWEDVQTGQRYSNVVSWYNNCKIAELAHGEKITLYVQVKDDTEQYHLMDCMQCQAVSPAPPQKKVEFVEISASPCEVSPN